MSMIDTPNLARLTQILDVTTSRQAQITKNVANVDTPGYHTRDINFAAELERAQNGLQLVSAGPQTTEVRGLLERPDGNNVSVEREGLLMAQTQLQFNASVQLVKLEFHRLASAINGGS